MSDTIVCSICLGYPQEPVMLKETGHTFCRACITTWLQTHNTCPNTKCVLSDKTLIRNYILTSAADASLNHAAAAAAHAVSPPAPVYGPTKPKLGKTANGLVLRTMGFDGPPKPMKCYILMDTSGSTKDPPNKTAEDAQLTLLDIIIHTVKAYIACLPSHYSYALYTYSSNTTKQMELSNATSSNMTNAFDILKNMWSEGSTNTLSGILTCLDEAAKSKNSDNTIILHFTDGRPDNGSFEYSLNRWLYEKNLSKFPATIINIGFGTNLSLGPLFNITNTMGGTFLYIPSYNECASVFLSYLTQTYAIAEKPLVIKHSNGNETKIELTATLKKDYLFPNDAYEVYYNDQLITEFELIEDRAEIIEQMRLNIVKAFDAPTAHFINLKIQACIDEIDKCNPEDYPELFEIRKDLSGQILLATSPEYYNSWGALYLAFIKECYKYQFPGNDKDFGMNIKKLPNYADIYNNALNVFNSIEFVKCANTLFAYNPQTYQNTQALIGNLTNSNLPCFAGNCTVVLNDGTKQSIENLKRGDILHNGSIIDYITIHRGQATVYHIGRLLITGTHPIKINGEWIYPYTISQETSEVSVVYNIILKNREPSVIIEDVECLTLAHGLTEGITLHEFYGTECVVDALLAINNTTDNNSGKLYINGVVRDENGWVCGLI